MVVKLDYGELEISLKALKKARLYCDGAELWTCEHCF